MIDADITDGAPNTVADRINIVPGRLQARNTGGMRVHVRLGAGAISPEPSTRVVRAQKAVGRPAEERRMRVRKVLDDRRRRYPTSDRAPGRAQQDELG
jgi:hypothetical protein